MHEPSRLQQNTQQNQSDADIKGEIDLAPFTEDDKSKNNSVTGLEIIGEINCKR